jgi:carboxylesterase type B
VCAQAAPKWQAVTTAVVGAYERGQRNFDARDYANGSVTTTPSARETEDCLFLDVYAPRTKLQNILGGGGGKRGLPVVVWIYGGGYVNGAKDLNPGGWFDRDRETGGEGIVVSLLMGGGILKGVMLMGDFVSSL